MESLLAFVKSNLDATRGDWDTVANGSGVSRRTLEKLGYGDVTDPRIKTVEKLAVYFRSKRRKTA